MEKSHAQPEDNYTRLGPPPSYIEATGRSALDNPTRHCQDKNAHIPKTERESHTSTQSSIPSGSATPNNPTPSNPIKFTVHVRKPYMGFGNPIITLVPTASLPGIAFYQLRYANKLNATLWRHIPSPQSHVDVPEVATICFPDVIWPGCGPAIGYQPHDAEMKRKGARHTSRTDVFMSCTGWLTTRYEVDLPPAMGRARVSWMVADARGRGKSDGTASSEKTRRYGAPAAHEAAVVQMGQDKTANEDSWTPFPLQVLIREDGETLASYARAAPWSNVEGWLTISKLPDAESIEYSSAEFVEAIVTVCTAMVGMQDRIGVPSSIVEAGFDSIRYSKGKNKAR